MVKWSLDVQNIKSERAFFMIFVLLVHQFLGELLKADTVAQDNGLWTVIFLLFNKLKIPKYLSSCYIWIPQLLFYEFLYFLCNSNTSSFMFPHALESHFLCYLILVMSSLKRIQKFRDWFIWNVLEESSVLWFWFYFFYFFPSISLMVS